MKRLLAFTVLVGGLLVLPYDGWSIGHVVFDPQKKSGEKVVQPSKPVVINRTPAAGGNQIVVPPPAKVPTYTPPKIITKNTTLPQKFPATTVHVDQKTFVENNKNKFIGVGQKGFVPKDVVKVVPPQIKFAGKESHPVVLAFHTMIGKKPIIVGGKTINIGDKRTEFVTSYQKHWSERIDSRHERGRFVRNSIGTSYHHLFTPDWWGHHRHVRIGWWDRWPAFTARWYAFNAWEWWRPAPWNTFVGWCGGPAYWGQPFYYDYGGNVIFESHVVYIEGQAVATEEDYTDQALQLAGTGETLLAGAPPAPDQIQAQWLPLGSWALTNEDQGDPTMFIQLAVNKQGVLMGTYYNATTDEAQPIIGAIDPKTQRAAWYIGDNKTTVMETGAYNLSAPETQVLVHFGTDQTQTRIMVRMQEPQPQ
jgi:hypothetical protein